MKIGSPASNARKLRARKPARGNCLLIQFVGHHCRETMTDPVSKKSAYEAHHAPRYERQSLIRQYQDDYDVIYRLFTVGRKSTWVCCKNLKPRACDRIAETWSHRPKPLAAVEDAERRIQVNPGHIHYMIVAKRHQCSSRAASERRYRTKSDQLKEALAYAKGRDEDQINKLASSLRELLIQNTQSHGAAVSSRHALGLPVEEVPSSEEQWQKIWRMWAKYLASIYEGQSVRSFSEREYQGIWLSVIQREAGCLRPDR